MQDSKFFMNAVMAKIYDIIVNGDGKVAPKSQDTFFSWCTPGVPFEAEDFDFLTQGLGGVYKPTKITDKDGKEVTAVLTDSQREQTLAKDATRMYQLAEQLARFVDVIPDTSGIDETNVRLNIKNDEGTLSDVYEEVLRFSQVANTELTAEEKSKIERFRQLLQVERNKEDLVTGEISKVLEPSPLVKAYFDKLQAYETAALEYNTARVEAITAKIMF